MSSTRLEAALSLAARGVAVFPCVPRMKRPIVEHGFYDATTDPALIRAWWTRWPNANLAMPTGQPGFDVVDIDVHADGDGYAHLPTLRRAGLLDGWSHAVRTPRGGMHLYFPGSDQRSGAVSSAHIDFRAVDGYVLVPPSTVSHPHGVGRYTVAAINREASRPVDWAAIRYRIAPPPRDRIAGTGMSSAVQGAPPEKIVQWLAHHVAQTREGDRNRTLFWAACRAAERAVSDPRPLLDAARHAGLTEREASRTIASAYRTIGRAAMCPPSLRRESRVIPRSTVREGPAP